MAELSIEEIRSLKVTDLKDELAKLGLSKTGMRTFKSLKQLKN